jgi:hypothetical protein
MPKIIDYPKLRGTAAQVRWATKIREYTFARNDVSNDIDSEKIKVLTRINDATWWIANRDRFKSALGLATPFKMPLPSQLEPPLASPVEITPALLANSMEFAKDREKSSVTVDEVIRNDIHSLDVMIKETLASIISSSQHIFMEPDLSNVSVFMMKDITTSATNFAELMNKRHGLNKALEVFSSLK